MGFGCFVAALFPALLVLGELSFHRLNLPFAICVIGSVAAGWLLIFKRNSPLSKKAKILITSIVFLLALLVIAIVIPNFIAARLSRASNACVNNLRQIEGAKEQWAVENNKQPNEIPTVANLSPYFKDDKFPICPSGGTYIIGRLDEDPKCTLADSTWPNNHALNYTNSWWTDFKQAYKAIFRRNS